MIRLTVLASVSLLLVTAVVPEEPAEVRSLIRNLGDPSFEVREAAARKLQATPDAAPWVRRATRDANPQVAASARDILGVYHRNRQRVIPQQMDAAIRARECDLFLEWHLAWQPQETKELWAPVVAVTGQATDVHVKLLPTPLKSTLHELLAERRKALSDSNGQPKRQYDGPWKQLDQSSAWAVRTDAIDKVDPQLFLAVVRGDVRVKLLL